MARTPNLRKNRSLTDLVGSMNRPKTLPEEGWHKVGPTNAQINFATNWGNMAGISNADAAFWLSDDGEVRHRGLVTGGPIPIEGSVIFSLPEECRPQFAEMHIVGMDEDGNIDLAAIRFRAWVDTPDVDFSNE